MIAPPQSVDQSVRTVTYHSGDGGRSWTPTLEVETGVYNNHDPTCAFGPDGTAYFATVETNFEARGNRTLPLDRTLRDYLLLFRSRDGGQTWPTPSVLEGFDRPWVTVDATHGDRSGRVYVTAHDYEPRADGGRITTLRTHALSPRGERLFSDTVATSASRLSNGVVLTDGTYVLAFAVPAADRPRIETRPALFGPPATASHMLKSIMSTDGGRSFSAATSVGPLTDVFMAHAHAQLSLATDMSDGPFSGRLYLAWADIRSGRYQILLSTSDDRGKAWSHPIVVNDDGPPRAGALGPDHYMPTVRVNGAGVVGLTWYDRRNTPDNIGYEVRFAASVDGGETFLSSVPVSEAAHTVSHDRWPLDASGSMGGGNAVPRFRTSPFLHLVGTIDVNFVGHTAGLAVTHDGRFQALWIDNRTGIAQIWTAEIAVHGVARRHGSPALESLADVSQLVTVHLANTEFHRAVGTVTTTAHIVNTSDAPLRPPLKLRAISFRSDIGRLRAANADNGVTGPGAIWDFSAFVDGAVLQPGAQTRGREIVFGVTDVQALDGRATDYQRALQVFDVGARVFATLLKTEGSTGR